MTANPMKTGQLAPGCSPDQVKSLSPRHCVESTPTGLRQHKQTLRESKMKTPNQRSAFARANLCTYVQNRSIPQSIPHIPAFADNHPVLSLDGGILSQFTADLRDKYPPPLIRSGALAAILALSGCTEPVNNRTICIAGVSYHVLEGMRKIAMAPAYRPDGTLQGCAEVGD